MATGIPAFSNFACNSDRWNSPLAKMEYCAQALLKPEGTWRVRDWMWEVQSSAGRFLGGARFLRRKFQIWPAGLPLGWILCRMPLGLRGEGKEYNLLFFFFRPVIARAIFRVYVECPRIDIHEKRGGSQQANSAVAIWISKSETNSKSKNLKKRKIFRILGSWRLPFYLKLRPLDSIRRKAMGMIKRFFSYPQK